VGVLYHRRYMESSLRFNADPYHVNMVETYLLDFREQGFVTLPGMFTPESVDAFRAEVEALLVKTPEGRWTLPRDSHLLLAPTYAPRLRQILPGALSGHRMQPHPSLFESAWLISTADEPKGAWHWHKDRGHAEAQHTEYHYPDEVHVGMYFEDMTYESGPTRCIPRSHRDGSLSPHAGTQPATFLPRKTDMVLWDQRLWHRGMPRTLPGFRIFALFGFYAVPAYGARPWTMPEAQRRAWVEAADPVDRVLYGGTFSPESMGVKPE
jgi:hypothetical protein